MDQRKFARTAKGQDEISGPRKALKGKMRTVLFLIDARRDADAIVGQIAQIGGPPDALAQLLADGYIEEIGGAARAGAAAAAPAAEAATVDDEVALFRVAKAFMNETIVDTLGIRAFMFTLRLERCSTRADLAALLPDYTEALAKKLDRAALQAIVARTQELLGVAPAA